MDRPFLDLGNDWEDALEARYPPVKRNAPEKRVNLEVVFGKVVVELDKNQEIWLTAVGSWSNDARLSKAGAIALRDWLIWAIPRVKEDK